MGVLWVGRGEGGGREGEIEVERSQPDSVDSVRDGGVWVRDRDRGMGGALVES